MPSEPSDDFRDFDNDGFEMPAGEEDQASESHKDLEDTEEDAGDDDMAMELGMTCQSLRMMSWKTVWRGRRLWKLSRVKKLSRVLLSCWCRVSQLRDGTMLSPTGILNMAARILEGPRDEGKRTREKLKRRMRNQEICQ
jgi:hypothetical protein